MNHLFSLSNPIYRHTIENSGYSVNLDNSIPVTGYMVSLKGYEKQINILTFCPSDIDQFIRANLSVLYNRKCYIGTWIENDIVFIDISMNLQNKRASLAFAQDNGQIAIFDILNNKTIYTLQTV
jgi:hypothetical protein